MMTPVPEQPRHPDENALLVIDREHGMRLGASTRVRSLPSGALLLTSGDDSPPVVWPRHGGQLGLIWPGKEEPTVIDTNAAIRRVAGLPPLRGPARWWHTSLEWVERWLIHLADMRHR
jgi:hypothetical protein